MDRNEAARREFAAAQEAKRIHKMFAADYAAGRAMVIDRLGQPVTPKALVIWRPPHDMVFEVADIKPILDPRVQPGLVELTLTCRVPVTFAVNQPIMTMIRVGTQQEPGHASLDEIKEQPVAPPVVEQPTEIIDDVDESAGPESTN